MEPDEDRSELFNEIQKFSQRKLKKVETKVKTGLGDDVTEKRTAKGLSTTDPAANNQNKNVPINQNANKKLDLQVGMVTGGLMIGSNDVATSSKTLNEYGITHVLNLAPNETDPFQFNDDFNYLEVKIDENSTKLKDVLDKCFDFIEEGQQRGNCFVHCSTAKPGLSRSTSICVAYLIYKDKKGYADAFNDVKEARAFVRPSDWFAKQLQEYATEQGSKQQEEQVEDKFTAKKRKEIEEEKAMLQKAVNLNSKKNLWNKQVEESQKKQLDDQIQQEKRMQNKLRNNLAFDNQQLNNNNTNANNNQTGPRKLTSLMSIFQQKDAQPVQPISKIVLNKAPVKKWAPVSTPHLQRTVKPETKNFDFYSKVKRAKSKDFKRAESLKKSKSKVNSDNKVDLNNNQRIEPTVNKPINQSILPPPPPPPLPISNNKQQSIPQPPPPPPPPAATQLTKQQAVNKITTTLANKTPINQSVKSTTNTSTPQLPPPPPPPLPINKQQQPINNSTSKTPSINSKTSSPIQSLTNSRTSSPQPSSTTSSRVSSPIPPSPSPNKLINKPLNNGLSSPPITAQNKLDPSKFNKFNKANDQNSWLNEKCVDYSSKLNQVKPVQPVVQSSVKQPAQQPTPEVKQTVRNIPIKFESKPEPKKEEIIELECEEEDVSEEEIEVVESEEESEESEESEEESEEETESEEDEESEESEESSTEESSSSSEEEEDEEDLNNNLANNYKPGGLTRSSTQEILKLIKSKTINDAPLLVIEEEDEDREIDLLLQGLEQHGVDNIDWSDLGIDLDDIKDIIDKDKDRTQI